MERLSLSSERRQNALAQMCPVRGKCTTGVTSGESDPQPHRKAKSAKRRKASKPSCLYFCCLSTNKNDSGSSCLLRHELLHSVTLMFQMAYDFNGDHGVIDPTGMFVSVMKGARDLGLRVA